MMATSLEQRMQAAIEQHRIWIDMDAEPFPRVHSWCGAFIDLDYSQGDAQMTRRLMTWLSEHKGCAHGESCRQ
jgi:hypothetical protein